MTDTDRDEFVAYLKSCTTPQLWGVYEKETEAGRDEYIDLCVAEIFVRESK